MKKIFLVALGFILIYSCDNKGKIEYYKKEGVIASCGSIVGDLQIGRWYYFNKDGSVKAFGDFIEGLPNGKWTFYDKFHRKTEFDLVGNKIDGYVVEYNCIGDTSQYFYYKSGIEEFKSFYSDSMSKFIHVYTSGLKRERICLPFDLLDHPKR